MRSTLDELRLAAFERCWSARRDGRVPREAVEELISSWRSAPLVAYAVETKQTADALPVLEQMVQKRTRELQDELRLAHRDALRGWALAAAVEPAA